MTNLQLHMNATIAGQSNTVTCEGLTFQSVTVVTDPASIQTGVSCGMKGMCGENPCLCGSPDAYGCCACNGLRTTYPTITVTSSNDSIAKAVQFDGKWYVIGTGTGEVDITVKSSLIHYGETVQIEHLRVQSASLGVVIMWILGFFFTIAVVVGFVFGITKAIRALIGLRHRRRARHTALGEAGIDASAATVPDSSLRQTADSAEHADG